jgi:hypothetical protein
MKATNLKSLRLSGKGTSAAFPGYQDGPLNFDFRHGHDTFPALEELSFDIQHYYFSLQHCQSWKMTMDWTKLRKLDLGLVLPEHFISALTDRIPQLKVLTFRVGEVDLMKRFLDSINGLEEVTILNARGSDLQLLWRPFLDKHGSSLLHLTISRLSAGQELYSELLDLQEQAPNLTSLDVDMATRFRLDKDSRRSLVHAI